MLEKEKRMVLLRTNGRAYISCEVSPEAGHSKLQFSYNLHSASPLMLVNEFLFTLYI